MPKTSKAPSTGKGMSLGKGSITSLKKTSVSHHSMKKTPKSPKTKSPGHSHAPAMVLPFCDKYCESLDESSLSTVVYRVQLTLSILDTVEATGNALEDLFDSVVASELSPVCKEWGTRRKARRLQDTPGTIVQVDFSVASNPTGDCSPVDADPTLTGACANYFVDAAIQYDGDDPNQYQVLLEEAVASNCDAIASLEQVEEAFDPCPYVIIAPVDVINGNNPTGDAGDSNNDDPQQHGDDDNDGDDDTDSSGGDQDSPNSGGSEGDLFVEDDQDSDSTNDETEGDDDDSQGPAALKVTDTNDDGSSRRVWPWIVVALCGLLICCTYCCLFAFQASRRDHYAHKKLGEEEDEIAVQKGILGSIVPDQSSGEESTVDTSSPGRPGIRSWDGSDGFNGGAEHADDAECPSSDGDLQTGREGLGSSKARQSVDPGTNGYYTATGNILEDPCGRIQVCCPTYQGTNSIGSAGHLSSGHKHKSNSLSNRNGKGDIRVLTSLIDDATSVDDEWDEPEVSSAYPATIQPALFTITDNLGESQPHQNVHRCTSALCQLCSKNKAPKFVSVQAPASPPSIPRDATRDYSLEDSVSL